MSLGASASASASAATPTPPVMDTSVFACATYLFTVQFAPTQDMAPNGGPSGTQQLTITNRHRPRRPDRPDQGHLVTQLGEQDAADPGVRRQLRRHLAAPLTAWP